MVISWKYIVTFKELEPSVQNSIFRIRILIAEKSQAMDSFHKAFL
jgi:hypothetical protein